jgi:hypothetical protein
MSGFSAFAFASPLWLASLALLPVLWWLLRVTPPAPRHAQFPAIALLRRLIAEERTPARTPWWLLLLRLVLAALVILALSRPLLNPGAQLASPGPLLLVIDDGWASARQWPRRQAVFNDLIDRAERDQRLVLLLATAPNAEGEPPRLSRLMRPPEARAVLRALEPKPWPVDRLAARAAIETARDLEQAAVVYLTDGMDDRAVALFVERMQRLGSVELRLDDLDGRARLLLPPVAEPSALAATARRVATSTPAAAFVRASAEDGRLLAREELRWAAGEDTARARIQVPNEIRNRIARIEIEGDASAGTVVLSDERWRRRTVGLVAGGLTERAQPLLGDTYYLERAILPFAEIRAGTIAELVARETAMIVLADVGRLGDEERRTLEAWIERGGVLVRFAGPRLAEGADALVPVALRADGGRSFGGAMTWAQPLTLAPFPPQSPFAGLAAPEDVRVTRQILAEPSLDIAERSWARLSDGTPLITGDRRGRGILVLMHTTATPEWSNLPISGLFVELLQRLVALSQGASDIASDTPLAPVAALDGFGLLQAPPPGAGPITAGEFAQARPSPRTPPGLYGDESARRALNLTASIQTLTPLVDVPSGVIVADYAGGRTTDLRPLLLIAAALLFLIDLLISAGLRGVLPRLRRRAAAAAMLLLVAAAPAPAQQGPAAPASGPAGGDNVALSATTSMRLAFVQTRVAELDDVSRSGLLGLGLALARRTAVDLGQPVGVDLAEDELAFFPLIYWPIAAQGPPPSPQALERVRNYLRSGGMIIFDTRDAGDFAPNRQGTPAILRLRAILRALDLAALAPVSQEHVLGRAFYLLREFPGRRTGGRVWIEQIDERVNDGVSSVIVGGHDWAAAWAVDARGQALYAPVPGGDSQREMAIRTGINMVMYALTGNYKADQVHVETIMERLRR